jgi:polyhydroxyalkanoate synthesis repressor PhaR
MPLIKRYPNRKLYDTEAKRYVTLEELTRIIQAGQDVQVIDHESGEDLTNLTLTQIILEQEKRSATGVAPRALLTGLIRAGVAPLAQMQRSLVVAPADVEATVEEQAGRAIEQGRQMLDQFYLRLDERLADLLHLLNLPTTRDLEQLEARIEELAAKLDAKPDAVQAAHTDVSHTDTDSEPL